MRIPLKTPITNDIPFTAFDVRGKGGAAYCSEVALRSAIAQAKLKANLVVVMIHGGKEYDPNPTPKISYLTQIARAAGASAFVHVSAIGADPESDSEYGRTKGLGELAVRDAFPRCTIIRPSVVFGPEDQFTNRFASLARFKVLPVIAPDTRFQPLFVRDLGQAIAQAALDPQSHGGKTYELAGPEILTMREINEQVADMADKQPALVDVPDFLASAIASLGFLPGAPLSTDQWLMLQRDNVPSGKLPGLKGFGITPTPLAVVAPEWLGRFRKGGRFVIRHEYQSAG